MPTSADKIKIYPHKGIDELGFQHILEKTASFANNKEAVKMILKIRPLRSRKLILKELNLLEEFINASSETLYFKPEELPEILLILKFLRIENAVLEIEDILALARVLQLNLKLKSQIDKPEFKSICPSLYSKLNVFYPDPKILEEIHKVFTADGEVKENASKELKRISMAMKSAFKRSEVAFENELNVHRKKGNLSDIEQTVRNGRRVLAITAANRQSLRGIIHDHSDSGKTIFFEPEALISINNDIGNLNLEKHREVYRLKKEITASLREYLQDFPLFRSRLLEMEVLYAKGQLAKALDAVKPNIVKGRKLKILNARHPVLFLKNKEENHETIPFDIELNASKRIVLISGPNAGGKSVLLKAVGILQVMLQSAFLIPCDEKSVFPMMQKIFIDIGDHQSLQAGLSTYSSHLKSMKLATKHADSQSLILFDEFGTGTDPDMGNAIAEAILRELIEKKCFAILTTHFGKLKSFAHREAAILNAAMVFDKDSFAPSYEFVPGEPGSSFTFEMAKKMGLPQRIINKAKTILDDDYVEMEELLSELKEREKKLSHRESEVSKLREHLRKLKKTYRELEKEMGKRKKDLQKKERYQSLDLERKYLEDLNALIGKLRKEKDLERAKALKEKVKKSEKQRVKAIKEDRKRNAVAYTEKHGPIQEGDFVALLDSNLNGRVNKLDEKNAFVQVGQLEMKVEKDRLRHAREPIEKVERIPVKKQLRERAADKTIDIRGMDLNQSKKVTESFLESAILKQHPSVKIIHGKGSGALRKMVHKLLSNFPGVVDYHHPPRREGGDGATIATL